MTIYRMGGGRKKKMRQSIFKRRTARLTELDTQFSVTVPAPMSYFNHIILFTLNWNDIFQKAIQFIYV